MYMTLVRCPLIFSTLSYLDLWNQHCREVAPFVALGKLLLSSQRAGLIFPGVQIFNACLFSWWATSNLFPVLNF